MFRVAGVAGLGAFRMGVGVFRVPVNVALRV